jgi:GNAT superfamily N-acetyltransferase
VSTAAIVRPLVADDLDGWRTLWRGYQAFYEVDIAETVTMETWRRLHDPAEPMRGLGAWLEGDLVGIMHLVFHRSTWTEGDYVYLQDLFTAEAARGRGVGRALIEAAYELAREAGASRVYWLTHESNTTARALYDKLADRSGFIQYRKLL